MVVHDNITGKPSYGVVLGTLINTGERTFANISGSREWRLLIYLPDESSLPFFFPPFHEADTLGDLEKVELVGTVGISTYDVDEETNFITFTKNKL